MYALYIQQGRLPCSQEAFGVHEREGVVMMVVAKGIPLKAPNSSAGPNNDGAHSTRTTK